MKKTLIRVAVFVVACAAIGLWSRWSPEHESGNIGRHQSVAVAVQKHASNVQVEGEGTVINLLPDDVQGSRHQRILVRLASGGTLLIAHNIDLAPRVDGIRKGETIEFCGEFEWNDKGGVVHWTHHDRRGGHVDGWIKYKGRTFQ